MARKQAEKPGSRQVEAVVAGVPMKGAQVLVKCLERAGVEVMFAYPGGASLELHQALIDSPIRVILPRHEQGGGFAAAGYARATGRTGVCMATSGPGATNLVTAIADAYMDSVPLVAVTGQVPQNYIGKNAFQETDIIGITRPICKHSFLVLEAAAIPQVVEEAFLIANSGRPGPVVVDITKDVQQSVCVPNFEARPNLRGYRPEAPACPPAQLEALRELIRGCSRPCLYVGGGIITGEASQELRQFAESYNLPVATTLMGVGALPEDHPLSLKWLGMHGTYYANYAANEADLLLALGVRFDDRVTGKVDTFAAGAKIVHVDIDPSEINKNKRADLGIVADIKSVLAALNRAPIHQEYAAWHQRIAGWKRDSPLGYVQKDRIVAQFVVEKLCELTAGEAVIVPGVGQHQMWAAQFYTFKRPRQHLSSGGLGTMGFGLPTAMGAKVACPEAVVVNIDGDGSFQMNIQELGTLHAEEIGVKMIIMNNQHLGMVAQWEDRFYGSRRGNTVLSNRRVAAPYPDFVQIAKGYMIPGRHVWRPDEVAEAIREMLETPGPFLLDVHIEYQEHVLPMIPAGKSYAEIIME